MAPFIDDNPLVKTNPPWLHELYADLRKGKGQADILLGFFINDFACLWNALARVPHNEMNARGNVTFTKETMRFLELISRGFDKQDDLVDRYSASLKTRNPQYFIQLPKFTDYKPMGTKFITKGALGDDTQFPRDPSKAPILLWLLFDNLRNGLTHSGIQNSLEVNGKPLYFGLTGNQHLQDLGQCENDRKMRNLRFLEKENQIVIFPETLFLDFAWALKDSGVYKDARYKLEFPKRTATADATRDGFAAELRTLRP